MTDLLIFLICCGLWITTALTYVVGALLAVGLGLATLLGARVIWRIT